MARHQFGCKLPNLVQSSPHGKDAVVYNVLALDPAKFGKAATKEAIRWHGAFNK
jgi:hypothetical protein